MSRSVPALSDLTRAQLAVLVPELLLAGHLIDRAAMPHATAAFGLEGMRDVAIEEWMGASPVYTRRMQEALGFAGGGVETIFKGMQLDVGAPPQFMDFRYRLEDRDHGEFWLDHCGALMDVEPMGEDYVVAMCHDIEDPTFDATAVATDPRAQVRPVHRPPRTPADRHPHCAWTVTIAPEHEPLELPEITGRVAATRAARVELTPIDPDEDGVGDYAGPLLSDLAFADFSHSALVRIAEEVCLQGHLLSLSHLMALRARIDDEEQVRAMGRRQLAGVGGLTSERIRAALDLPAGLDGAAAVLALHPALLPRAYVDAGPVDDGRVLLRLGRGDAAHADGAWPSLVDADHLAPLDAILRGVDPHLRAAVVDDGPDALVVEVVADDVAAPEVDEVALTRFSTGADFAFADRGTPVALRPA
ncbi:hypothetical protein PO878_20845 [Iamia majanohamensis]|uniref:Uncharacterized protein n=1 Tax=Iamia majanohamensis TaxID=467976 RepID=A0AAE9Y5M2_9ACTN|nr:hypothetical protein [Iamia majanohamensis]WCO66945.1 hypothetical protein PO878_20845 [Iamia majanohamensis]